MRMPNGAALCHKRRRTAEGQSDLRHNRKMITALIIGVTVVALLALYRYSRGSRKFEMKMVSVINANCRGRSECLLRLQDVTDFEWDKMVVFGYGASDSEVEHVLGIKDHRGGEFQRNIVFTKEGKIVFHEEEPVDVERPLRDEVIFNFSSGADYAIYPHNVVFKVSEKSSTNGRYYELSQVL